VVQSGVSCSEWQSLPCSVRLVSVLSVKAACGLVESSVFCPEWQSRPCSVRLVSVLSDKAPCGVVQSGVFCSEWQSRPCSVRLVSVLVVCRSLPYSAMSVADPECLVTVRLRVFQHVRAELTTEWGHPYSAEVSSFTLSSRYSCENEGSKGDGRGGVCSTH
jgi:hypothetical protein